MTFNKSFYKQVEIDEEVKTYDAHAEQAQVEFPKCNHKKAKVVDGSLRCPCGAAWSGPRLSELLNAFKGEK